jgi:hypothetical protein
MFDALDSFLIRRAAQPLLGWAVHGLGRSKGWLLVRLVAVPGFMAAATVALPSLDHRALWPIDQLILVAVALALAVLLLLARLGEAAALASTMATRLLTLGNLVVCCSGTVTVTALVLAFPENALPPGLGVYQLTALDCLVSGLLAFLYIAASPVPPPPKAAPSLVPHAA